MTECSPEKAGFSALIVEDEALVRDLLKRLVEGHGYKVMACGSVAEAMEAFEAGQPQLVLMDWMLAGGEDGLALSRKLRASARGKYLTILMISGKDQPEDIASAIDAGVNYFMVKPVEKSILDTWLSVACRQVRDSLQREEDDLALAKFQEELEANNLQLEEALARANQLAMEAEQAYIEINQIFKTVAGGILLVDRNCKLLRCNDSFLRMAGVAKEEARGRKCYEIFHSCLCNTSECPLQKIKKGKKRIESEIEKENEDGSVSCYHIISTPFVGPSGDLIGIVEHITDITERVKAERALAESERRYRELSTVDELTRLYNKRYFNKQLRLEVARAKRYHHPLSLLLMDIDNFKIHNDTYGHADGDRVLARLGKVIAGSLRTNDVPCRYGGEEFTIILPDTSGENAAVVAERIRTRFADEVFSPKPEEKVRKTVSIGLTQYRAGESEEALLERADHNMYQAKQGGKNRCVLE
ncbi:diguanylate cyclase [Thiovibrio sp. JS02]